MKTANHPGFDGHEAVIWVDDEASGLGAVIAIHSTALGPAIGGCRLSRYPSRDAALTDALRLSQGMSYKNALAGLPAGGGKAVIYRTDPQMDRAQTFEAFGRAVDSLAGRYVTAEDVGTGVADMLAVARSTAHVAGLPDRAGLAGGDPSPWTALGVFGAIEAAMGRSVRGARIAVQGLGSVGSNLCRLLHAAGASLVVADVDQSRTDAAEAMFNAKVVPVDDIHKVEADLFSPNALGAVLNEQTIPELGSPVICGGANNQLATPADGERLFQRQILYTPDYVANAGGIINVVAEYFGEPASAVKSRVMEIGPRVAEILARAAGERRPSNEFADALARRLICRDGHDVEAEDARSVCGTARLA